MRYQPNIVPWHRISGFLKSLALDIEVHTKPPSATLVSCSLVHTRVPLFTKHFLAFQYSSPGGSTTAGEVCCLRFPSHTKETAWCDILQRQLMQVRGLTRVTEKWTWASGWCAVGVSMSPSWHCSIAGEMWFIASCASRRSAPLLFLVPIQSVQQLVARHRAEAYPVVIRVRRTLPRPSRRPAASPFHPAFAMHCNRCLRQWPSG